MKSFRFTVSALALATLGAGYLGSQYSYLTRSEGGGDRVADWAARVDSPALIWLALIVFLGSIALWLIPESKEKT